MQEGNEGEDAGAGSSRPQNASNKDGDDGDDSDDSDYEPVEVLSESSESEDDVDDDDEYLGDGPDAEENEHDQWERELGGRVEQRETSVGVASTPGVRLECVRARTGATWPRRAQALGAVGRPVIASPRRM